MIILGFNCGFESPTNQYDESHSGIIHDTSAVLIKDGVVVSAIEEERLNRLKHTNKFPERAIQFVLDSHGLTLDDVDYFAFYSTEEFADLILKRVYLENQTMEELLTARSYISLLFKEAFGREIDQSKICFIDHHLTHAASAFHLSGYDKSLVLTLDGVGESFSGKVFYCTGQEMKEVDSFTENDSLGYFYLEVTRFLGYDAHDEYKVMGLAPYGDPSVYRDVFSMFYDLLPEGKFNIKRGLISLILYGITTPRRKKQEFEQIYKNLAAALQEALENIVLHIVKYHAEKTGMDKLCMAGGVALNCSANGKIYYSGLFNDFFVQPAAYDAGCALGAACQVYMEKSARKAIKPMEHVFLGTDISGDRETEQLLEGWGAFLDFEYHEDIARETAAAIERGDVVGWVQGKSEFGPRALGNRSILADPRPHENKTRVNKVVKKREAYRPFAPSVISEKAGEFFDIDVNKACFDYMNFAVQVRPDYVAKLGAITHVDGTARVQTVRQEQNPLYWQLLHEFGALTGIPMLLNTSFNNNVEPIVNTPKEAIECFLTTGLDALIIGNYMITKKKRELGDTLGALKMKPMGSVMISSENLLESAFERPQGYQISFNAKDKKGTGISKSVYDLISINDVESPISELVQKVQNGSGDQQQTLNEIEKLWSLGYVSLFPN